MGSVGPTSQHGQRLLHVTIDEIARDDPDRVFASLPYDDDDLSKGYEDITFSVLANAINKLAWYVESCLGPSTNFETFAYIGTPDLRYQMMAMAAAKTKYRVLFSSHVHSTAAHLNLMEKTNTQSLLSATGIAVADILAGRKMPHFTIPELDDLLSPTRANIYPYTKPAHLAMKDDYLILHSSGSTGLPKPITINHGCIAALDNQASLTGIDPITKQQRRCLQNPGRGTRMLVPFLPFHSICTEVLAPGFVFHNVIYVPGLRNRITKPSDILPILDHANITDAFFSPAMIEDLVQHPDAPAYLSKIRTLSCGGASMNASTSTFAARYTNLQNQWGITESGKGVDLATAPEDFAYNAFDLTSAGFRFEPLATVTAIATSRSESPDLHNPQQLHQLFIDPTPSSLPYTALFSRISPTNGPYNTGDLWLPHPNPALAPFTFRFIGRADDLISFKDGSNFHPTDYELMHAEHPSVRSAVLAGVGHREVVLLLELWGGDDVLSLAGQKGKEPENEEAEAEEDAAAAAAVLEKLWTESIAPVNERTPKNGRVRRSHVVVVNHLPSSPARADGDADAAADAERKRFERTAKGTVARKATIRKFDDEIEACYRAFGDRDGEVMQRLA